MNITTTIVKAMRYKTVGDWTFDDFGNLQIQVLDTGNEQYNTLIAVHELVEAALCRFAGITSEQVDEWDMKAPFANGDGPYTAGCPYLMQHNCAEMIERSVCTWMELSWEVYSDFIDKMEVPTWEKKLAINV